MHALTDWSEPSAPGRLPKFTGFWPAKLEGGRPPLETAGGGIGEGDRAGLGPP
jgi:hypothetical protein